MKIYLYVYIYIYIYIFIYIYVCVFSFETSRGKRSFIIFGYQERDADDFVERQVTAEGLLRSFAET